MAKSPKSILERYDSIKRLWYWDGDVLRHSGHPDYAITADRFKTGDDLASWLEQLGEKLWVKKEDLVWLGRAFKERQCRR